MKVKFLEYKIHRGFKVKVQSHNKRKGKWVPNPKWDWHQKVIAGETHTMYGIYPGSLKQYSKELE